MVAFVGRAMNERGHDAGIRLASRRTSLEGLLAIPMEAVATMMSAAEPLRR